MAGVMRVKWNDERDATRCCRLVVSCLASEGKPNYNRSYRSVIYHCIA